jgi:hypothetical protein
MNDIGGVNTNSSRKLLVGGLWSGNCIGILYGSEMDHMNEPWVRSFFSNYYALRNPKPFSSPYRSINRMNRSHSSGDFITYVHSIA